MRCNMMFYIDSRGKCYTDYYYSIFKRLKMTGFVRTCKQALKGLI